MSQGAGTYLPHVGKLMAVGCPQKMPSLQQSQFPRGAGRRGLLCNAPRNWGGKSSSLEEGSEQHVVESTKPIL